MSAPRTLHLLRHGAPERTGLMLGRTDCPASREGIAECVARAVGRDIAHIVSSDLCRATACAAAIAAAQGLDWSTDAGWRELDFGAWDGLPSSEIDSEALGRFWTDPDRDPPPGGECWSQLTARVEAAVAGLATDTLVVTHGGTMRAALAILCGFTPRQVWAFDLPCAALLSFRIWPDAAQVTGLAA